ncbi:MAG TPA: hypothetical protein VHB50_17135, partial [Bryobacteraceae bacterium]|nr:hypothetical protein [Bryobacteraceae bacterium]
MLDFILVRSIFVLIFGFAAAYFRPAGEEWWSAALVGGAIAGFAIFVETRVARVNLKRLIGMAGGLLVGLFCAGLVSLVLGRLGAEASRNLHCVQIVCLLLLVYVGAVTGAAKGELLNLGAFGGVFGTETDIRHNHKILDTSVIIDGRIADIADTGFLDGVLVIPQFV